MLFFYPAGVFQLSQGPSFTQTYTYEAIVLVINGQFTAAHLGGATYTLKEGDSMHVKMGCKVQYSTNTDGSRFFFTIQPPQVEDAGRLQAGWFTLLLVNLSSVHIPVAMLCILLS